MQLLSGTDALRAAQNLLAQGDGLAAIDIDPQSRAGQPPSVLAIARQNTVILIDAASIAPVIQSIDGAIPLGAFDAKVIHRALLRLEKCPTMRWACVKLTDQLLSGGRWYDHGLDAVAKRHNMAPPPDANEGFEALGQRTKLTAQILGAQIPQVRGDQLGWVSKIEAAAIAPIAMMEHMGLAIDADMWRGKLNEALCEQKDIHHQLTGIFEHVTDCDLLGSSVLNFNSDQELKTVIHALGHKVPNVKKHTLAALPAPLGPLLSRYRELAKLESTYGASFLQHVQADGRLHSTFEQIGAATGRMASRAPNLQSIVKDAGFRASLRCDTNRRLIIADYATCELRILAEMSRDPVFGAAFERGEDLHAVVASHMFRASVSKEENPHLRQRAKAINFGLVYGMGPNALERQLGCSPHEARKLFDGYFHHFPHIGKFLAFLARLGTERGFAQTISGRRLYIKPGTTTAERAQAERISKNMPIQGSSADMTKIALGRLCRAFTKWPGTTIVNAVHDEIVVECNANDAEAIKTVMVTEMIDAGKELLKTIPIEVDAIIAQAWLK